MLSSFEKSFASFSSNWQIIIADDGSSDGTLEYIQSFKLDNIPITLIKNNRQGIHHQFNSIVRRLEKLEFDYCFKCDDDIEFIKSGWDKLYINAIEKSGYDHLCHFEQNWRPEKTLKQPIQKGELISHCLAKDVQGAFFTLTPDIIKRVGYMDTKNFGFRGVGHIDYTMRACRAGFNDIHHPYDAAGSNDYIKHQTENYQSALNIHVQNALESEDDNQRKYKLIEDSTRIYIPYGENSESMDKKTEHELLEKRIEDLEGQLKWYKKNYDHQPKWFARLGKVIGFLKILKQ